MLFLFTGKTFNTDQIITLCKPTTVDWMSIERDLLCCGVKRINDKDLT